MNGFEGFGLIVAHMCGDYLAQNDWMARNKTNPHPGPRPRWSEGAPDPMNREAYHEFLLVRSKAAHDEDWGGWDDRRAKWRTGHLACTVHCLLYTLSVWAFSFWWMPWWGLAVCFLTHWPIDRFRLAGWWMRNVSGQAAFASGPLSPWSIIVVDQVFHLLTLFLIGVAS